MEFTSPLEETGHALPYQDAFPGKIHGTTENRNTVGAPLCTKGIVRQLLAAIPTIPRSRKGKAL